MSRRGPQTEEGKKRALQNLQRGRSTKSKIIPGTITYDHFKHIKSLLPKSDYEYYVSRWNAYLIEYEDFDNASDVDDLHSMVMELVIQRQLQKQYGSSLDKSMLKEWGESVSRMNIVKKNLATSRDRRIKSGENLSDSKLSTLILEWSENKKAELQQRSDAFKEEEKQEALLKKQRDKNLLKASGLDKLMAGDAKKDEGTTGS